MLFVPNILAYEVSVPFNSSFLTDPLMTVKLIIHKQDTQFISLTTNHSLMDYTNQFLILNQLMVSRPIVG